MKTNPITPPPELVQQWLGNHFGTTVSGEVSDVELAIATQAAQWGADQELEACCDHMRDHQWGFVERPDGTKIHRAIYLQQSRARALLAQPVPVGLTDQELLRCAKIATPCYNLKMWERELNMMRAAIAADRARWGRPPSDTESLRSALRECGRAAGAFISDECSDEFLLQIPAEVRLALTNTVWADIHYAWELHDAEGEWQAGGSANSLEDVQREGNRYLQTYSQDGPHKLIIQRHCVTTIEEPTND